MKNYKIVAVWLLITPITRGNDFYRDIQPNDWNIALSMKNEPIKAASDVVLVIKLKNVSDREQIILRSRTLINFAIRLKSADGTNLPLTELGERMADTDSVYANRLVHLQPGEIRIFEIDLAKVYRLDVKGDYKVIVNWPSRLGPNFIEKDARTITKELKFSVH
jgi:hypothetical protein